jgi:hypothetical protein
LADTSAAAGPNPPMDWLAKRVNDAVSLPKIPKSIPE